MPRGLRCAPALVLWMLVPTDLRAQPASPASQPVSRPTSPTSHPMSQPTSPASQPASAPAPARPSKQLPEDRARELLRELEFIDEAEVKAPSVRTGLEELLETVVVTATKQQQPIAAAPAIISVVTSSQIRAMGYRTVAEALQSLPGLYLLHDGVEWNAGVRGVNGGQRAGSRMIKVMIDGQPISFRPSGANWLGLELIPIDAVSHIEMIHGPSSALYGANAFLGVVNVITRSGALMDGALVGGHLGGVQHNLCGGGSLVLGKKSGNLEVLLAGSGSFADRSGLQIGNLPHRPLYDGNTRSRDDTSTPGSLFMKLFYLSPRLGALSLDLSYQRLQAHGEFQDWGPLVRGREERPASYQQNLVDLQQLYIRARVSRAVLDGLNVSLSGAFATMGPTNNDHLALDRSGVDEFYTREVGSNSLDVVGEVVYTPDRSSSFTVGADFTADWQRLLTYWGHDLPDAPGLGTPIITTSDSKPPLGERLFHNVGAYLQGVVYPFRLARTISRRVRLAPHFGRGVAASRASVLDTLGVTLGLRYDHQNIYGDALNYRAGLVFLWRRLNAKLLYGTSFKAPASVQLFTGKLVSVVGNDALNPERAQTVELQLGGELFAGFSARATWFYTAIEDKVEIIPDPNIPTQSKAQNVSSIRSTGLETSVAHTWRGIDGFVNLSLQKSTEREDDPLGGTVERDAPLFPGLMLKLGLAYREPRIYLGASVEARYIGGLRASPANARVDDPVNPQDAYSLDGYFTMDLSLFSVDLNLLRDRETFVQLKVSNLTDATYYYPGFRDFDIPAPGRSVILTLTQRL